MDRRRCHDTFVGSPTFERLDWHCIEPLIQLPVTLRSCVDDAGLCGCGSPTGYDRLGAADRSVWQRRRADFGDRVLNARGAWSGSAPNAFSKPAPHVLDHARAPNFSRPTLAAPGASTPGHHPARFDTILRSDSRTIRDTYARLVPGADAQGGALLRALRAACHHRSRGGGGAASSAEGRGAG